MKEKTTFIVLTIIGVMLALSAYNFVSDKLSNKESLKGQISGSDILVGSTSNLRAIPKAAVFDNSTTTYDAAYDDGKSTVTQKIDTSWNTKSVKLNVQAIGPNATSTFNIRQMGSYDGIYFYDIATSTANRITATTTIGDAITSIQWDPGTATSSKVFTFDTEGYNFVRFIMWSEGWTGHLDTGVQAFVEAVKIQDYSN